MSGFLGGFLLGSALVLVICWLAWVADERHRR